MVEGQAASMPRKGGRPTIDWGTEQEGLRTVLGPEDLTETERSVCGDEPHDSGCDLRPWRTYWTSGGILSDGRRSDNSDPVIQTTGVTTRTGHGIERDTASCLLCLVLVGLVMDVGWLECLINRDPLWRADRKLALSYSEYLWSRIFRESGSGLLLSLKQ